MAKANHTGADLSMLVVTGDLWQKSLVTIGHSITAAGMAYWKRSIAGTSLPIR